MQDETCGNQIWIVYGGKDLAAKQPRTKNAPVYQTKYDVRYIVDRMRKFAGAFDRPITESDLPKVNPTKLLSAREKLLAKINAIPHYDFMYTGRDRSVPEKGAILSPKYPRDDD